MRQSTARKCRGCLENSKIGDLGWRQRHLITRTSRSERIDMAPRLHPMGTSITSNCRLPQGCWQPGNLDLVHIHNRLLSERQLEELPVRMVLEEEKLTVVWLFCLCFIFAFMLNPVGRTFQL